VASGKTRPSAAPDFHIGSWLAQPTRNLIRTDETVRRGNVHGDPTEPDKAGRTDVFNYSLDGWVTLAVADATVYRLCRDVLLRTSGPRLGQPGLFQEYLGIGTHAALLANKR
jgi:hypothetical protein